MSLYKLTNSLRHDGEDYSAGDEIELTDAEAEQFRTREWLDDGKAKTTKSKPTGSRRKKPVASTKPETDNKPTATEIEAEQVL